MYYINTTAKKRGSLLNWARVSFVINYFFLIILLINFHYTLQILLRQSTWQAFTFFLLINCVLVFVELWSVSWMKNEMIKEEEGSLCSYKENERCEKRDFRNKSSPLFNSFFYYYFSVIFSSSLKKATTFQRIWHVYK